MSKLRPIKTLNDALLALERGFVVDEVENSVPDRVCSSLGRLLGVWERGRRNTNPNFHALALLKSGVAMRIRYEGNREIRWFG